MKKLLAHPLVMLGITIFVILFVISLQKTAQKSNVATENVRLLEENNQLLIDQIEQEKDALEYANTDLSKEKIIRNELLMQKPGEYVIQIPNDVVIDQQSGEVQQQSAWDEWQQLLF